MAERDAGAAAIIPLTNPYQVTVNYGNKQGDAAKPFGGWFGPLQPMTPVAPPDTAGRRFDYPSGYNLNARPRAYERIGFAELRALADNYDLMRVVIETRKDQMDRARWLIRAREEVLGPGKKEPSNALKKRIADVTTFLRKPDRLLGWKPWLRMILEDMLVIDAPALYKRRTRGGELYSLEIIDGATIKPVIDEYGRTPLPPYPAYQQVLKGMPAVDYTARDIIYRPRNPRSNRVYGFSPVEQVVMTVNIALRRQVYQLQYYTEGNVPEALIGVPDGWTPDQIATFQNYWDGLLEGNTASRRHAKFVPGGLAKGYMPTKEPELTGATDEWLARIVCFCFSISSQPFVKQINRGEADTAAERALDEGLGPLQDWVKDAIDEIILEEFGETDLEFGWVDHKKTDPNKEAERLDRLVRGAQMRPNESREALGLDPDPDPNADKLGTVTAAGFVPIEISAKPPEPPPDMGAGATGDAGGAFGANGKKPAADAKPEVGKAAGLPFAKGWRALPPVKPTRRFAREVAASLTAATAKVLAKVGKSVAHDVRAALHGVAKADETEAERESRIRELAQRIADAVDLDGLSTLVDVTGPELERLIRNTASRVLAQLGVADQADIVDQVNERAVEVASERAADLVGKRWVDGELVDNPNAEFSILDSTRDMIRETITGGLRDNLGLDEIAGNIEALGFSEDRADLISRTEIARANSDASIMSYEAAQEAGVVVRKAWILGENPCAICEENADAGDIEIDDDFPSGDDAPPAHPNCECAVTPVVEDGAGEE